MINIEDKRILITGGRGFLGQWVIKELVRNGARETNLIVPPYCECDLRDKGSCIGLWQTLICAFT